MKDFDPPFLVDWKWFCLAGDVMGWIIRWTKLWGFGVKNIGTKQFYSHLLVGFILWMFWAGKWNKQNTRILSKKHLNSFILLLLLIANKFGGGMLWAGGRVAALHRNSEEAEEQTIDGLENQSCPPGGNIKRTNKNAKHLNNDTWGRPVLNWNFPLNLCESFLLIALRLTCSLC